MKKKPQVSVIICTKDRIKILEEFALKSLFKQNYPNYEIIVVDDASNENAQQKLHKYKNKLRIIRNNKSRGLCYVRNLGVKYAKGDLIAFTDDDCIVDKNWINELVRPFLADPAIMVVGGKILIKNSKKIHNNKKQIFCGDICFRKEIFDRFLFDTNLYFNKCSVHDETELLYRLKNKGFKLFYNDKAVVRHFKKPAAYRKNRELGAPLNKIYMYTKKMPITNYYYLLFITPFFGKQKKFAFSMEERDIIDGFDTLIGLFSPKQKRFYKLPWILYVLLFELPIKAKIKDYFEEKKWRKNG